MQSSDTDTQDNSTIKYINIINQQYTVGLRQGRMIIFQVITLGGGA